VNSSANNSIQTDIIIIGAGASGMMAAHFCAQNGKEVYVLEHNNAVGKKILISGGGKCNFTNLQGGDPKDYYSENPHFVKSALSRYSPWEFIGKVIEEDIPYEERLHGQLFCKRSAKDIVNLLSKQMNKPNIHLELNQKDLRVVDQGDDFVVYNDRISVTAPKLIVATGGLVLPSIGASDFGYILAKRYGHKIRPTSPALVPFKIPDFTSLSGNSFIAGITCNGHYVAENVLFTHKGLSGPGILKTSLFWHPGDEIEINWMPGKNLEEILLKTSGTTQVQTVLRQYLPNQFVQVFLEKIDIAEDINMGRLSKTMREKLATNMHSMKIVPEGTLGFRKAEVTRGGICTDQVSSKTLESKLRKGLHFIGEVLDVTGQLGGHNFQWCWASANAVGEALK
jgi:predicted Rossmann fold flavoprotein